MHYILNSPPPTEIISFLHKIQIIGEWHDLRNLNHLMADVKAQGEACFSSWFLPLAGWLALLLDGGPHPHAYQPRNAVVILTSQSPFTNYFTHYGSRCAQPHPVHSVSGIKINLNIQDRLCGCVRVNIKLQTKHNSIIIIYFREWISYCTLYWILLEVSSVSS